MPAQGRSEAEGRLHGCRRVGGVGSELARLPTETRESYRNCYRQRQPEQLPVMGVQIQRKMNVQIPRTCRADSAQAGVLIPRG